MAECDRCGTEASLREVKAHGTRSDWIKTLKIEYWARRTYKRDGRPIEDFAKFCPDCYMKVW